MVTHLTPDPTNEMFGRDAFYIRRPSQGDDCGQESNGCIVIPHADPQAVKGTRETQIRMTE